MKFLVIRLSSIGDIVLTTPVLRALKSQIPGCEIHFVVKRSFYPVVEANPNIDRIFQIEKGISEILPALEEQDYDQVIDLHKNFRSFGIRLKLKKKATSFPKLNFRKWLLVHLKIASMPDVHIVDRYFKAVEPLGVRNDGKGLEHFIPGNDRVDVAELLPAGSKEFIAFVVGAKHMTKTMPEERIIEICRRIQRPVVLVGGKEDRERGRRISELSGDHVINTCGNMRINQSADIIRQADAVITHDTGMMHIASAFRKKIVSLWGNTVPEFGMYPYMPGDEENSRILEVSGLRCRPCSKIGFEKCPKGHFKCMKEIDIDDVLGFIR